MTLMMPTEQLMAHLLRRLTIRRLPLRLVLAAVRTGVPLRQRQRGVTLLLKAPHQLTQAPKPMATRRASSVR